MFRDYVDDVLKVYEKKDFSVKRINTNQEIRKTLKISSLIENVKWRRRDPTIFFLNMGDE